MRIAHPVLRSAQILLPPVAGWSFGGGGLGFRLADHEVLDIGPEVHHAGLRRFLMRPYPASETGGGATVSQSGDGGNRTPGC
jgi:hypothetical protein